MTTPAFQQYQLAFTAHIRDPKAHGKPRGVVDQRMAVYRHAIFNNFFNIVSACFPVCQQVLGARAWKKLVRRYVAGHAAQTPIFRQVPETFITFLNTLEDVPAYIKALAHYEWVELAVSHLPAADSQLSAEPNMLDECPQFAPHQLLAYDYPVHQISRLHLPKQVAPTYLLVYRDSTFDVRFIALNPVTFQLLTILETQVCTGRQAITALADTLGQDPQRLIAFGEEILLDLFHQQALIGTSASVKK